jgi:threonine/homoserine/homoserine lactone efflux protein
VPQTVAAGELAWFASAVAFAVAMSATPGPNNTMVAASGANWGFWRTLPHILGISVGFAVMLVAVALGAGELLRTRPWAHEALRWIGACYLLWLACRIAVARPKAPAGPARAGGRPLGFVRAALFQWMNPKAWVIAAGAIVTYTTGNGGTLLVQAALLAAIFLVIILPAAALWTLIGVGAARLLRTPRALRRFNLAMAALLVASLLPLLRGE